MSVVGDLNKSLLAAQEAKYDKGLETELRQWMASLLPDNKTTLLADDKSFYDLLKNGVILCKYQILLSRIINV